MKMYHPLFLSEAKQLCERYGLHFIADEILVGFGRTGSMFACEQADITPDFLVLSKGLTGGYLPLSVVLTTEEIYGSFYCDYNPSRSFLHSHSYTEMHLPVRRPMPPLIFLSRKMLLKITVGRLRSLGKN